MALGAYSILRFSDNMRDERVNLGVVVWHPRDGFSLRVLPTLDRIHAVDPSVKLIPLRKQLKEIACRLEQQEVKGEKLMAELSNWLRDGLEFGKPCPARISSVTETADRLFNLLVPDFAAAGEAEISFRENVTRAIRAAAFSIEPHATCEDMGERMLSGVRIAIGIHTSIRNTDTLWRSVSMRARADEDKIARAKSAAMDIVKISGLEQFQSYRHVVTVEAPRKFSGGGFNESKKWIEGVGATVLSISNETEMTSVIDGHLRQIAA